MPRKCQKRRQDEYRSSRGPFSRRQNRGRGRRARPAREGPEIGSECGHGTKCSSGCVQSVLYDTDSVRRDIDFSAYLILIFTVRANPIFPEYLYSFSR